MDPRVGLCSVCQHGRQIVSARGSMFWLCDRAATDARYRKYPPLPVGRCAGFEAADQPEASREAN